MIIDNPLFSEDIPEKGAARGHLRFTVKSRQPDDVALVGFCANVAASLLFERLQAQGTNIIVALKDDTQIDVLARSEDDKINLVWPPKSIDPAQLNDIQERIRNKTFSIGKAEKPIPKLEMKPEQKPEPNPEQQTEAEEDYLVKQLHRIP